jgi:hypothetical protein
MRIDPMVSRAPEHQATVQIRLEELELRPAVDPPVDHDPVSFAGKRVEVVEHKLIVGNSFRSFGIDAGYECERTDRTERGCTNDTTGNAPAGVSGNL